MFIETENKGLINLSRVDRIYCQKSGSYARARVVAVKPSAEYVLYEGSDNEVKEVYRIVLSMLRANKEMYPYSLKDIIDKQNERDAERMGVDTAVSYGAGFDPIAAAICITLPGTAVPTPVDVARVKAALRRVRDNMRGIEPSRAEPTTKADIDPGVISGGSILA